MVAFGRMRSCKPVINYEIAMRRDVYHSWLVRTDGSHNSKNCVVSLGNAEMREWLVLRLHCYELK